METVGNQLQPEWGSTMFLHACLEAPRLQALRPTLGLSQEQDPHPKKVSTRWCDQRARAKSKNRHDQHCTLRAIHLEVHPDTEVLGYEDLLLKFVVIGLFLMRFGQCMGMWY